MLGLTTAIALAACSGAGATGHSSGPAPATTSRAPFAPSASPAGGTPHAASSPPAVVTPSSAATVPGTLISRKIPGVTSRFAARRAVIYLPPILRTQPHLRLPLLVLLHGTPGGPSDWTELGRLRSTADAFAATNGGRAPVIVMPDINGSPRGDSECIQVLGASIERYLTVDVPRWVRTHLPVNPDQRHWAIGGSSEGGTCGLMLSLRHPAMYPT